jgi:THO complex subunit 1
LKTVLWHKSCIDLPHPSRRLSPSSQIFILARKMSVTDELDSVQAYRDLIEHHLTGLNDVKHDEGIEPPLTEADCGELVDEVQSKASDRPNKKSHYALIETVFREKFYSLLETESIDEPSFTKLWNLLDVVAILSDHELCEPGLIFWLVEELLDSQIIDGCRKVFDYLESRRERITAVSTFQICF